MFHSFSFCVFDPTHLHLLFAVVDFDNTDTAWRKYDSSKYLQYYLWNHTIEWLLVSLLLLNDSKMNCLRLWASYLGILYVSYCKGAFQTVWVLTEALSGRFWSITSSRSLCSSRAMQCSCYSGNTILYCSCTPGLMAWIIF